MEERKKVSLQYPINTEIDGTPVEIKEIELGRLKVKHLKLLPKDTFVTGAMSPAVIAPLIGGMTGLNEDIIEMIDFVDLQNIAVEIESFLGESPETGKKSSGE